MKAKQISMGESYSFMTNTNDLIYEYLINDWQCVLAPHQGMFSVLSRSHSDFYMKILDNIFVKSMQPFCCGNKINDC